MRYLSLFENSDTLLQISSESAQNLGGSEELKMHFNFVASFWACSYLTQSLAVFEMVQHLHCHTEGLARFSQDIQQQSLAHPTCTDQTGLDFAINHAALRPRKMLQNPTLTAPQL